MNAEVRITPAETIIRMPGLKKSLTILQITDCHLTACDEREEPDVRAEAIKRTSVFASQAAGGHSTEALFDRLLQTSNELGADFTVFTGDIIDFPSQANIEHLQSQFSRLKSPYLYTVGNHDWYFYGSFTDEVREAAYPKFREWISETPGCEIRSAGGVKLIALDNSNYQVTDGQVEAIKRAAASGEPYLLFMHIPLYVSSLRPDVVDAWGAPIMMGASAWPAASREAWQVRPSDPATKEFCRFLASEESGNLRGIFCGHVHFNHVDAFREGRYQYVTAPGFTGQCRLIRLLAE
ncbi:metallophosphoesterase family protein [Paenibacillus silvisoli]|uniref:metallophosphoesterase family protein n=1 Tax=Paenibacillus silvisoli TaxID=3110539 RepID=UPI0028056D8D|nr:metallophosphoesterase [Paenibacillus silvisoli]